MKRFRLGYLLSVWALALCAQSAEALPGDLDTFGQAGFAFTGFGDVGLDFSSASGVAIQSDGKIVVAGSARTTGVNFTQTAWVLARFNIDGTVDTTFGSGGRVQTTSAEGRTSSSTGRACSVMAANSSWTAGGRGGHCR